MMGFFTEYEKRAFAHLGFGFLWVVCWIVAYLLFGNWFGLPADNLFEWFMGMVMFVGFVYLEVTAVILLVVGQWKMLRRTHKTNKTK